MSATFDPRDPLGFGRAPARATTAVADRPVLPPGGTRRAVAELLGDDDVAELMAVDSFADDLLGPLFPVSVDVPGAPSRDGWTVGRRDAVERLWCDGTTDTEVAPLIVGDTRRRRRRAQAHRRPGRRAVVAGAAAAATVVVTMMAPLVLRASRGGGDLGSPSQPGVLADAPRGIASDGARLLTSWPPMRGGTQPVVEPTPGPATAGPLLTSRSPKVAVFYVVFDRLCRADVEEVDDGSGPAERTISALTAPTAPPCGHRRLERADLRIVPNDLAGATVELGERYATLSAQQQLLIVGQIVLSLDANDVSPVRFVSREGAPIAVPTGDETYATEAVTASQYGFLFTSAPEYRPARRSRD